MDNTLSQILSRLDKIEEEIEGIKENAEITREATNELVRWAELAGDYIKVEFQKDDY